MYLVVQIQSTQTIGDINAKIIEPTKALETVVNIRNYCDAILAGCLPCTVTVVSKDASTSISTSGAGSQSVVLNLL